MLRALYSLQSILWNSDGMHRVLSQALGCVRHVPLWGPFSIYR